MDEVRKIRYLVAPFFFFASLLWGNFLAHKQLPQFSMELLTLVVASFFPIGFLIGAFSHFLSKLFFLLWKRRFSEVVLDEGVFLRIWGHLGMTGKAEQKWELYASATFDHETISKGVHEWIMRSWSGYIISTHSFVALVLAFSAGLTAICIPWTCSWLLTTLIATVILLLNAGATWNQCTKMIEFQSMRSSYQLNRIQPSNDDATKAKDGI